MRIAECCGALWQKWVAVSDMHSGSENETVTKLLYGEGILLMDSQSFGPFFSYSKKDDG